MAKSCACTLQAQDGATVRELIHRLGHKTQQMAIRYQRATDERDKTIADNLGARFRAVESAADHSDVAAI